MTRNAMGGKVTFRKALADRLQLIKPSRQQIEAVVSKPGLIRLTPGMRELVRQLQARGTEVFLVSGGFHELIDPVAKMLNIPVSNVTPTDSSTSSTVATLVSTTLVRLLSQAANRGSFN